MIEARNYYEEAVAMLSGATSMLPEMAHLIALRSAMHEQHECALLRIAHELDELKQHILGRL